MHLTPDTGNAILQMFRGPNFKGDFIQVDRMADGVITFLDVDNAERFKSLLEAEQTHAPVIDPLSTHCHSRDADVYPD